MTTTVCLPFYSWPSYSCNSADITGLHVHGKEQKLLLQPTKRAQCQSDSRVSLAISPAVMEQSICPTSQ